MTEDKQKGKAMKLIRDITSMDDLGISDPAIEKLLLKKGYTPATVVAAARTSELTKLDGVGKAKAKRIVLDLERSGYIDDESVMSARVCWLFEEVGIISRGTREAYESYEEFTQEEIDKVLDMVKTLTPFEERLITMRFGLNGDSPATLSACSKCSNYSSSMIQIYIVKALEKLAVYSWPHRLETLLPSNQKKAEQLRKEIEEEFDSPTDRMLLEDLHLPKDIREHLSHAGVKCVGHLRRLELGDLVSIPELKLEAMGRIIAELRDTIDSSR